ncbi:MAG: hypothetical protein ACE5I1_11160 [bacterium]
MPSKQQNTCHFVSAKNLTAILCLIIFFPIHLPAQTIPISEFAQRREQAMARLSDGILLLHARTAAKKMEQWGFVQEAAVYYFIGLAAVKPGVSRTAIFAAGKAAIERCKDLTKTEAGRAALAKILGSHGGVNWHLHGVGIESGEEALEILQQARCSHSSRCFLSARTLIISRT